MTPTPNDPDQDPAVARHAPDDEALAEEVWEDESPTGALQADDTGAAPPSRGQDETT